MPPAVCAVLAWLLGPAVLVFAAVAQSASDPRPAELIHLDRVARSLGEAALAGKDAVARELDRAGVDWFLLADALWRSAEASRGTGGGAPRGTEDALEAMADLAREVPRYEALPEALRAWRAWDAQACARERRLDDAVVAAHVAKARCDPRGVLDAVARVEVELDAADRSLTAVRLWNLKAGAHMELGDLDAQIASLERMAAGARELGARSLEAYAWSWIGEGWLRRREPQAARTAFANAVAVGERSGADLRVAEARTGIALALAAEGDLPQARAEALLAWGVLREARRDWEGLLVRLAHVLGEIGAVREAAEVAKRAVDLARAEKDRKRERSALTLLGGIEVLEGRLREGLRHLEAAQAIPGLPPDSSLLGNLAVAAERLCDLGAAARGFERALEAVPDPDPNHHRVRLLTSLGNVHFQQERFDEAVLAYATAEEEARRAGVVQAAAHALACRGGALARLGRLEEAESCLRDALRDLVTHGTPPLLINARVSLAYILERRGLREEARAHAAEAIELAQDFALDRSLCAALELEAWLLAAQAETEAALVRLRRLLRLRLDLDSGLDEPAVLPLRDDHREVADQALRLVAALGRRPGSDPLAVAEAAFDLMEAGRAVALAESLARIRDQGVGAPRGEAVLRARERFRVARRSFLAAASGGGRNPDRVVLARRELEAAHEELRQARVDEPRPGFGPGRPPAALDEFRERLAADQVYAAFHLPAEDTEAALALVVDRSGATLHELGPAARVLDAIADWRALILAGSPAEPRAAARVHDLLVAPWRARLGASRCLLIAPDPALGPLPFEALLGQGRQGLERLVECQEIVYVPSATVALGLADLPPGAPRGILALGDPEMGVGPSRAEGRPALRSLDALDPLPHTRREVLAVSAFFPPEDRRILLGAEATPSRFLAAASSAVPPWAVHLACHGVVDESLPGWCGLVLSGPDLLGPEDLDRIRLPAAITVLSACDTARAQSARSEGTFGLVRGFFMAGCPRVVVTLWRVEDDAAAGWAEIFYGAMRREGQAPAEALAALKRAAIRGGGAAALPRRWAAAVLWGLPGAPPP